MLFIAFLIVVGVFALFVSASTSSSRARTRAAARTPDGPGTPEENERTYHLMLNHQANVAYNSAAAAGQLGFRRSSFGRRWGSRLLVGAVIGSALHHGKDSDGGGEFNPYDLDQRG